MTVSWTHLALAVLVASAEAAIAADRVSHAELWRSWNMKTREAYISGVSDGGSEAYYVTATALDPDAFKSPGTPNDLRKAQFRLFFGGMREQLEPVVTDLYKDPANSNISMSKMIFVARDRLRGKDVTQDLAGARAAALLENAFKDAAEQQLQSPAPQ